MSDVEPDLHAIFEMEGEGGADSAISVEREDAGDPRAESFDPFTPDGGPAVEIELDEAAEDAIGEDVVPAAGEEPVGWTGITQPSRRGSSSRFLTDVIIEM